MIPDNQKPAVWVGHVAIHTSVVARSCEFMQSIGMRLIMLEAGHQGVSVDRLLT